VNSLTGALFFHFFYLFLLFLYPQEDMKNQDFWLAEISIEVK